MRAFIIACLVVSLAACKREPTPEQKAASKKYDDEQARRRTAVQARLDSIAALKGTVDKLTPADYKGKHVSLNGEELHENFDVLFADQLADLTSLASVYVTHRPMFESCARVLHHREASFEACSSDSCLSTCEQLHYLVVVRPRSMQRPVIGTSSYTPGSIDADAFVFDLNDGHKLVGGGHIVTDASGQGTMQGKWARNDIEDAFGKAIYKAILAM
jgi:hypothetical protein